MVSVKLSKLDGKALEHGILKSSGRGILKLYRIGSKFRSNKILCNFSDVFWDLHKLKIRFCNKNKGKKAFVSLPWVGVGDTPGTE